MTYWGLTKTYLASKMEDSLTCIVQLYSNIKSHNIVKRIKVHQAQSFGDFPFLTHYEGTTFFALQWELFVGPTVTQERVLCPQQTLILLSFTHNTFPVDRRRQVTLIPVSRKLAKVKWPLLTILALRHS